MLNYEKHCKTGVMQEAQLPQSAEVARDADVGAHPQPKSII